jgi:hypothetical protein
VSGAGDSLAGSAPVGTGVVLAGTEYITLYENRITRNGAWGVLVAEALCATQLLAPCPSLPEATYPRPVRVELPPLAPQAWMPNPCAGVPSDPWCP